jgi:hypothetical protein
MIVEGTARVLVPWTLSMLAVGMLLGGAAGYALARTPSTAGIAEAGLHDVAPARRPLPREWRWTPPTVDFEGMFRRPRD